MEVNQRVPFIPKTTTVNSRKLAADRVDEQPPIFKSLFKLTIAIIILILLIPAIYLLISRVFLSESMKLDADMLEVKKCPACAGQSICPYFYRGEIRLTNRRRGSLFQTTNNNALSSFPIVGNNAIMGFYETRKNVLLRRLASPATPYAVDKAVCRRGLRQSFGSISHDILTNLSCIPHLSIWRWLPTNADANDPHGNSVELPLSREILMGSIYSYNHSHSESEAEVTTDFAPATRCSSDRLFEHLQHRFLERTSYGAETRWLRFDELMFLFNLAIDPQSVIIQSFPRKENWPFPHYLGSCGRWSVEEYHGVPISHFCLASVWIRLQILLNILSLPEQLEHKSIMNQTYHYNYDEHYSSHGYTIYLGDFDFNSLFLVDPMTYDVTIANLRHAIIVDTQTLSELHFESTTNEHSVPSDAVNLVTTGLKQHNCLGNTSYISGDAGGQTPPCLSTSHADDLCSHIQSDHNIWVICSSLFYGSSHSSRQAHTTGCSDFLYQMPNELYTLIERCVHQSGAGVRRRLIEEMRRVIKQNL
ncbi:unnamed protein product [Trichobilharzia szidati]|nr:unnamed protein product [Trichobilharzia szidati]